MKKRIISCLLSACLVLALMTACSNGSDSTPESDSASPAQEEKDKLTDVTLNEVAHSIFYAPMYVAIEEGYFADEGIALDLVCGFGDNALGKNAPQNPRICVG